MDLRVKNTLFVKLCTVLFHTGFLYCTHVHVAFIFLVLFYVGFAHCLYCFYIMSPITMKYSSATLVNLSILTGNVYNLCWGLFLFNYKVSYLQEIHSRASIISRDDCSIRVF